MRSIIDEIAQAEREADEIRREAVSKGRERIAAARGEAETALAAMDDAERETLHAALEAAERDGETEAGKLLGTLNAEADDLCKKADARLNDTVEYLLHKVRGEQ